MMMKSFAARNSFVKQNLPKWEIMLAVITVQILKYPECGESGFHQPIRRNKKKYSNDKNLDEK